VFGISPFRITNKTGEDQCLVSITYKTYIKFVELFKKELKSFLCVFVLTLYATYYSPFIFTAGKILGIVSDF
jgi:hypothetical protein